jgi:hypothetical protein
MFVKLVKSDRQIEITEKYATLSRCWDNAQVFELTKDTSEQLRVVILMKELSKTFQDAISVTKSLGLRYIWIDLLCIIKDLVEKSLWESITCLK